MAGTWGKFSVREGGLEGESPVFQEGALSLQGLPPLSAISFILLYPWSDIFQDGEEKYNVFEASSLVYNPSTGPYYVTFYVLLGIFVFFGMIMTLLRVFKKTSFLLGLLEFFGSIITAWLGLFYFFYTNGRNVFTIVSFLLGSILAGIYFVFSLTRFIVKRMEKKVEKKIQKNEKLV